MNEKLKNKRLSSGFTQLQVASHAGISIRSYQRYESGERLPTVIIAQKIAEFLGCQINNIFNLVDGNPQ